MAFGFPAYHDFTQQSHGGIDVVATLQPCTTLQSHHFTCHTVMIRYAFCLAGLALCNASRSMKLLAFLISFGLFLPMVGRRSRVGESVDRMLGTHRMHRHKRRFEFLGHLRVALSPAWNFCSMAWPCVISSKARSAREAGNLAARRSSRLPLRNSNMLWRPFHVILTFSKARLQVCILLIDVNY